MSTPEFEVHRAIVHYSSPTTGEAHVRIPSLLGAGQTVTIPTTGLTSSDGFWNVPSIGSSTFIAVSVDRTQFLWLTAIGVAGSGGDDPSNEPIGHEDRTASYIAFDNGTRTFSIQPANGSYVVWCVGLRYEKKSLESIQIPNTTGLYYISFNAQGQLQYSTTYFVWDQDCPTAYVYWNSTTQRAEFFADERHGITMDWQTHEYLHRTRGAAYANGFDASNFDTSTQNGNTDAQAKLDIDNGTFFDEDLQVDVRHSLAPAQNTWEQQLQGPARIPVFYRSGTSYVYDAPTDFPVKQGTSHPLYNSSSGGNWSTTELGANSYGIQWIVGTNQLNYPILSIMGQTQYSNVGQAEAASWADMDLDGLPIVEIRVLYKIVFRATGSNTPGCYFDQIDDYRNALSNATSTAAAVVDHGNLTGLADDDHPQYLTSSRADLLYADINASPTITLAGDATGSVTLTDLGNGTLTLAVVNDSHTHDGRYYTETESDSRFVNVTGDTMTGALTASGGINGLTLANGISGSNFNITGVNQLEIADPGEGIVWKAGASGDISLYVIDDASDNILHTNGTLSGERLRVGGHYIDDVAGSGNPYGSISVGGAMSWDGYSIDQRVVFMHDGGSAWGIYNDVNNHWMIYGTLGGGVELKYNNTTRLWTDNSGGRTTGRHYTDGSNYAYSYYGHSNIAGTGNAIHTPNGIYSTGTNWLYGSIITNNNSINAGSGVITCGEINQNGGTVNDLYGETKFRYVSTSNDWSAQPVQEISSQDCGYACRSYDSDTHTGQLRAASGTWYARSHNDGSYWTLAAVISNQSSRHLKQDIETWGVAKPLSSAVNVAYETTATDLLNELRVVSYRWKKQDALPADIPSERRSNALDRLNRIRRSQGLDQYDGDEAIHRCGRDCDASEESPCDMYRNWERGTLGLVAEEVGEVIPEVTNIDMYQHSSTRGQNTAIDGLAMTAMCVKAIQELSARNAELEERLNQLEATGV
jgi:hypothetical protein